MPEGPEIKRAADQLEQAIALPQQSYQTGGITNDIVAYLKSEGYSRSHYRHWVFNRAGKPYFVCGTPIVKDATGGRRYYYCPTCQAV
jgi:endonuclease-8